jgi:hypothetical protein
MSASCANGHESETDDYCDVCGLKIGSSEPPSPSPLASTRPSAAEAPAGDVAAECLCPDCGTVVAAEDRFCENCGHDLLPARLGGQEGGADEPPSTAPNRPKPPSTAPNRPKPPSTAPNRPKPPSTTPDPPTSSSSTRWEIVAEADPAYFEKFNTADLVFPAVTPVRRFSLTGDEITIGRRSVSQGISPTIDLSAAPTDGAISHLHAVLVRQADGSWVLVDPGSANGVYLNEAIEALPRNVPIALEEGTRVHLGAWTTLTLRRADTAKTPVTDSAATERRNPEPRMVHPPGPSR